MFHPFHKSLRIYQSIGKNILTEENRINPLGILSMSHNFWSKGPKYIYIYVYKAIALVNEPKRLKY